MILEFMQGLMHNNYYSKCNKTEAIRLHNIYLKNITKLHFKSH